MKKPAITLSANERFPLIEDLSFLSALKQDRFAPRFNFESGDRLDATALHKVNEYSKSIRSEKQFWEDGKPSWWVDEYLDFCIDTVPFYQSRSRSFSLQPTIRRFDIKNAPWLFVSSTCSLEDLLVYQTSGTTGAAMDVIFDPVSQACWLPQLESILDRYNIFLSKNASEVSIALICSQESTLTYASLSTYLQGAGVLKINLNVKEWKHPSDRNQFLEKYNPEILTGDPFAFAALLELNPDIHPKAFVSSAMKLSEGLRKRLESRYQCLVLDIYSLTECRMIAYADGQVHKAIRPDLYLEIFDEKKDELLPYGARGELVVTGGNNPFLPLIRYRTGDICSLRNDNGIPVLIDLEARHTVPLFNMEGQLINNIDISRAMTAFPLVGFQLHQNIDKSISFTGWGQETGMADLIQAELARVFGDRNTIIISLLPPSEGPTTKVVSYTSDF